MRRVFCLFFLIVAACASAAIGQDDGEQRIKRSLVGRTVLVKMDMPAVDTGVVLILDDTDVTYDAAECAKLVKDNGVAIKNGSHSRITDVRISARGLEIDLDGGGLPGPDWIIGNLKLEQPAPIGKSDREVELERQSLSDSSPAVASYLRSELDYERQRRLEQDVRNREAYNRVAGIRREYIEKNRKNWGSKLVIVVRSRKESVKLRDMVKSLAKYVELIPIEKPAK